MKAVQSHVLKRAELNCQDQSNENADFGNFIKSNLRWEEANAAVQKLVCFYE